MAQIGKTIKKYRVKIGMTQDQLAEKLCVTRQAVSNWETGKTQPSIETLTALSALFDISVEALIYGKTRRIAITPDNATGAGGVFAALFFIFMTILFFTADALFSNIWWLITTISLILAGLITALFVQAEKLNALAARIAQLEEKK